MTQKDEFSIVELGNQRGENLIFLGGFPDDNISGWSPLFELLKHKYNLISLCFPQFAKGSQYKKWGYTFDELIFMLDQKINQIITSSTSLFQQPNSNLLPPLSSVSAPVPATSTSSFTLICHDWGSLVGLLYLEKYSPLQIKRLILVDVGIKSFKDSNFSFWELFLIILYQWWYSVAYIISQYFGVPLGNCIFVTYMIFVTMFPFLKISPEDTFHRPASEMTVEMCYLYYQYWKLILQGKSIELKLPNCPILYLYGTKKNVMFHGQEFLNNISTHPYSRSVSYECGHYPMHQHPVEMAQEIEKFIQETEFTAK